MDMIPVENESKKVVALTKAGATRERAYETMVKALDANIISVDKYGDEHSYPDTSNQLKAAEMIAKLHGDMKEGIVIDNRVTTVSIGKDEFSILLSVARDVQAQIGALRESGQQTGEIIDLVSQGASSEDS